MDNKTAKQQVIENAYGEYWEKVKDRLSRDAWFTPPAFENRTWSTIAFDNGWDVMGTSVRPKSLDSIETNNGWTKIESEEDLPKDKIHTPYRIIDKNKNIIDYWFDDGMIDYWLNNFTHYKPIEKELLPIY